MDYSSWVKLGTFARRKQLGLSTTIPGNAGFSVLRYDRDHLICINSDDAGTTTARIDTSNVYRDPSAWYHCVVVYDSANANSNDRYRLYVNGERVSSLSTNTQPSQNLAGLVNKAGNYAIGAEPDGSDPMEGYLADAYFIDGQALEPTAFGRYNDQGVWVPREVDFTPAEMRYSDFVTTSSGGFQAGSGPTNLFDGTQGNDVRTDTQSATVTWAPGEGFDYATSVEVFIGSNDNTCNVSLNGTEEIAQTNQGWNTVDTGSGTITSLAVGPSGPGSNFTGVEWGAIRVDGEILTNPFIWSAGMFQDAGTTPNWNSTTVATAGDAFDNNTGSFTKVADGQMLIFRPTGGIANVTLVEAFTEFSDDRLQVQ